MRAVNHQSSFAIRDRVIIDADKSIIAHVVAIRFYDGGHDCTITWFADGAVREATIDHWRLSLVEAE